MQPMRWRLQFRLRTLLIATMVMCLCLGSWRLFLFCFGPYVEATPTDAGEGTRVRGRFLRFRGKETEGVKITVFRLSDKDEPTIHLQQAIAVKRVGLWRYEFDRSIDSMRPPGHYRIELKPAYWWSPRSHEDLPVVSAELIVLPGVADDRKVSD